MSSRALKQGIQTIREGNVSEGARLVRWALDNSTLTTIERVEGYKWLAETEPTPQAKRAIYLRALEIDPGNPDLLERLRKLQGQGDDQAPPFRNDMPPINDGSWSQTHYTPNSGMPPINDGNWSHTGNTPNGGMPPINDGSWPQTHYTPNSGMPPINEDDSWRGGFTPADGMPPITADQDWRHGYKRTQNSSQGQPSGQAGNHNGMGGGINSMGNMGGDTGGNQNPIFLNEVQRTVGILDGPNGPGTGFFISRDGLVATTRHVTGGARQLTIALLNGQRVLGEIVRSFLQFDIALIQTPVQLAHLMAITQSPDVPDNLRLVAVNHAGRGYNTTRRQTRQAIEPHWFPTLINYLPDAGGEPVFRQEDRILVGLMTRNASRSNGYLFGLHIHKVYQCMERYLQEKQELSGQRTTYCHSCGIISRAAQYGGNYCENCGQILPQAQNVPRLPKPELSGLYGENMQQPCPNCGSQAGFFGGKCQRCGFIL